MIQQFKSQIEINAQPASVWEALTTIEQIKQWMGEPQLQLEINTSWIVGSPIVFKGFHHVQFENKGIILHFEPNKTLAYTHLSSLSELKDQPENYTIFEFSLKEWGEQTLLSFTADNFPTETIYKHLELYWKVTLVVLKEFVENPK